MKHFLLSSFILGLFFSATSQNVGVGTSSPAQRLSVSGTLGISETGNTGNRLQISSTGGGADIFQNDNSPIIFRTLTSVNSSQEKMRISDNGNVGIGNSGPAYKLDVAGDVRATGNGILNSASPTWFFQDSDERSGMIHMNGNLLYFLNGSGTNSLNWSINGSHWPLYINMNNDDAVFGGRAFYIALNYY